MFVVLLLFVLIGIPARAWVITPEAAIQQRGDAQYLGRIFGAYGTTTAISMLIGMGILAKSEVSEGFIKLWRLQRLDFSVEALVLRPEFRSLFTQHELAVAHRRLADLGYRVPEPAHNGSAHKGSQLHLQNLVNRYTDLLNCLLLSASPSLRKYVAAHPDWVSPLETEEFREYRDAAFLKKVGLPQLVDELASFWPAGGPAWDGLATVVGKNGGKGVILLEAKSHAAELRGPGSQASDPSRHRIIRSLEAVKEYLGVPRGADWVSSPYYQYANRLAHLYFLHELAQVPTWLVFLYFVNDVEQNGPRTVAEWEPVLAEIKSSLQLPIDHRLSARVVTLFAPATAGKR